MWISRFKLLKTIVAEYFLQVSFGLQKEVPLYAILSLLPSFNYVLFNSFTPRYLVPYFPRILATLMLLIYFMFPLVKPLWTRILPGDTLTACMIIEPIFCRFNIVSNFRIRLHAAIKYCFNNNIIKTRNVDYKKVTIFHLHLSLFYILSNYEL